jgi:galactokinase
MVDTVEESVLKDSLTAHDLGAIGARQAGAGFGGCMVAFVEQEGLVEFTQHVRERYEQSTGIEPEVYPVQAAPGAAPLVF